MKRNRLSILALILIISVISIVRLSRPQWERNEILTWDVFGYYLYLPATFIHHDIKLEQQQWIDTAMSKYPTTPVLYQVHSGPKGNRVILYTSGMAMMYSPFFFTAHVLAKPMDYEADGLSTPYQLAIAMGCLLYTIIGLIFARKILLRFFNDKLTAILLLLLVFGTNYFHLTAYEGIMPHNTVFMLYTLIVWFTIRWHEDHKAVHAFLLGVFMALAILARGSEIVCLFIPLLWGIKDKQTFKEKLSLIWRYKLHFGLLAGGMFIIALPQLLYWRYTTGLWIYDSYGDAGFSFGHPYLLQVLLSYKKGWLVYTPLMLFALLGFIPLYRYRRDVFWAVFVFFLLNFYIVASWDVWWYAASFGHRALMQSYAVMMIPLGMFFLWAQRKKISTHVAYALGIFFVFLNLFQTWQYSKGIIDYERMTKNYYWAVFMKTSVTGEDRKLLEVDRGLEGQGIPAEGYTHHILKAFNFEAAAENIPAERLDTLALSGKHSFRLDSTYLFSPSVEEDLSDITSKDHAWIRASVYIWSNEPAEANPSSLVISCTKGKRNVKYYGINTEGRKLEAKKWNKISMDFITPYILGGENIQIYVWHRGKQPVWIDDMVVEVFEPLVDKTE